MARQHKIPKGKKHIAHNSAEHGYSSSKTPILQAGHPPITRISGGRTTVVVVVAVVPYVGK